MDLVHLTLNGLHYYHYGPSAPPTTSLATLHSEYLKFCCWCTYLILLPHVVVVVVPTSCCWCCCYNFMLLMMLLFQLRLVHDYDVIPSSCCWCWVSIFMLLLMMMLLHPHILDDDDAQFILMLVMRKPSDDLYIWQIVFQMLMTMSPPLDVVLSPVSCYWCCQWNTLLVKGECWNIVTSKNILPKRVLNNTIILYLLIRPYCAFVKVGPIVPWQLNVN